MAKNAAATVDTAYRKLRDRLVTFAVKPGARLNETEVAQELTMSRAPVREALNRLVADGLVSFEPGRGFFCRRLSVSETADLYAVRLDLETGALRTFLQTGSEDALKAFVAQWRAALPDAEHMEIETLVDADEAFHIDLASMAGNLSRVKFLSNINDRIRFVRRINLEAPDRKAQALSEHARVLDAVADRDADRAVAILSDHLHRSTEEVTVQVRLAIARIYSDEMA
jgi:DNA-binding GntR family transcriptional regulator